MSSAVLGVFQQAIRDEKGQVDVAYLAVFYLMVSVLGAISVVCFLDAAIVLSCVFGHGMKCTYDPQALGIAVGAICGGFAAALGALGAYMRLVQPPKGTQVAVGGDAGTVIMPPAAAVPAAAVPAPQLPPRPRLG